MASLNVVNLFALMSTDPKALLVAEDPVGSDNDAAIHCALEVADKVVLAWGNHGLDHRRRVAEVTAIVRQSAQPFCLGVTLKGAPRPPSQACPDNQYSTILKAGNIGLTRGLLQCTSRSVDWVSRSRIANLDTEMAQSLT